MCAPWLVLMVERNVQAPCYQLSPFATALLPFCHCHDLNLILTSEIVFRKETWEVMAWLWDTVTLVSFAGVALSKLKIHACVYYSQQNFIFQAVLVGLHPSANLAFALSPYALKCTTVLTAYRICVWDKWNAPHAYFYQSVIIWSYKLVRC